MIPIPVVIPCQNELENLKKLIPLFHSLPKKYTPILVDNKSTDGSGEYAASFGWHIIRELHTGYGSACHAGIKYALKNFPHSSIIAFYDADLSEDLYDLPLLINILQTGKVDLVIGSRAKYFSYMPTKVRTANIFFAFMLKAFYRTSLKDNGPMRAIYIDKLLKLHMKDKKYGWTFEMTIKALKLHFRILGVPIKYSGRYKGYSKISGNFKHSLLSALQIMLLFVKHH